METKWTKGEWNAKGLHIMATGKNTPIGQSFLVNFNHDYTGKSVPDIEGLANAQLISAAPNLYEAAQAAYMDLIARGWNDEYPLCAQLLNALNKAKGL